MRRLVLFVGPTRPDAENAGALAVESDVATVVDTPVESAEQVASAPADIEGAPGPESPPAALSRRRFQPRTPG